MGPYNPRTSLNPITKVVCLVGFVTLVLLAGLLRWMGVTSVFIYAGIVVCVPVGILTCLVVFRDE